MLDSLQLTWSCSLPRPCTSEGDRSPQIFWWIAHRFDWKCLCLWANAFYKSKCPSVRLSVRVFTFEVPFLPPLLKVRSPIFLEIRNPWGEVMARSGIRLENFSLEVVFNRQKKFFFGWFGLRKQGGNHASQWIRDLWSKGLSLILAYF